MASVDSPPSHDPSSPPSAPGEHELKPAAARGTRVSDVSDDAEKRCESCGRTFAADELFCPLDGAPLVARGSLPSGDDPYIGLTILGQIEIKRLAGAGSMARVYQAFQRGVDRDVAVKILHRELSADPEVVKRFHQEAKVASRLSNPHLVNVLLTAELPKSGDTTCGELVLVTEFLDGMSLQAALGAAGGALPLPRALHIVFQVCNALAEAHRNGVVHRDVKPENVMLLKRGEDRDFVKVLDFGLARLANKDASFATRQGAIFGSPRYISPEGAQGLPVGPPADVYAVVTLLYQMLAGRTPFEADSPVGFLLAHTSEPAPPVTSHARAAYVPAPLAAVIEQNLQKDPQSRAKDAQALAVSLRAAADRAGFSSEALSREDTWLGAPGKAAEALTSLAPTQSLSLSPGAKQAIAEGLAAESMVPSVGDLDDANSAPKGHTLLAGEDDLPRALPIVPTLFDAPSTAALTTKGKVSPDKTRVLDPADDRANGVPDVPALEPPPPRSSRPLVSGDADPGQARAAKTAILEPRASTPPPTTSPPSGSTMPGAPTSTPLPPRTPSSGEITPPPPSADAGGRTSSSRLSAASLSPTPNTEASGEPSPLRAFAVIAACFLFGGGAAVAGAKHFGGLSATRPGDVALPAGTASGATAAVSGAASVVAEPTAAEADRLFGALAQAEQREEWEGGPTSVREIWAQLEREQRGDPRFAQAREAVSQHAVSRALALQKEGDVTGSARLCALAMHLDSDNTAARALARELGRAGAAASAAGPSPTPRVPSSSRAHPPGTGTAPAHPAGTATGTPPASSKDTPRWL
jgi:eukaryotic-like serine/threonine-protein kinase